MNEIITEQIQHSEIIPANAELISEQIINDTEKIGTITEQIDNFPEIIPEKMPEKRRYRGQRGQDKAPRQLNQNSLMNLKPFKNNIVALERETTFIGLSDDKVTIIGIILLIAIFGIMIWKIIEWLREPIDVTSQDLPQFDECE